MDTMISQLINSSAVLKNVDAHTGLLRKGMAANLATFLEQCTVTLKGQPFWYVQTVQHKEGQHFWLYESRTGLLWRAVSNDEKFCSSYSPETGEKKLSTLPAIDKSPWRLPHAKNLLSFAKSSCPWREGSNLRLFGRDYWSVSTGCLDLDHSDTTLRGSAGNLIAVCDRFAGKVH